MKAHFYRILAASTAMLMLVGCSDVRPLYSTDSVGYAPSVQDHLADIKIPEPKDRLEQLIRNELISSMSPPGRPGNGQYSLDLNARGRIQNAYVATDSQVTRRIYFLQVSYVLTDSASGNQLYKSKTFSEVAYDRVTSQFANLQAETNAEQRAATEVAQDIRTRLAAYFAKYENKNPQPISPAATYD